MNILYTVALIFSITTGILLLVYQVPTVYPQYEPHIKNINAYLSGQPLAEETATQMTQKELIHMQDVWLVMMKLKITFLVSTLIVALLSPWHDYKKAARRASVALLAIAGLMLVAFRPLFFLLHEVIFPNDYWLLPADSFLISIYPQSSFMLIGAITFISAAGILGATGYDYPFNEGKNDSGT